MKNKFLQGWNFRRMIYLIGGIWMITQSAMDKMWLLIPFGIYFVLMSVFRFGCALGNCEVNFSDKETEQNHLRN